MKQLISLISFLCVPMVLHAQSFEQAAAQVQADMRNFQIQGQIRSIQMDMDMMRYRIPVPSNGSSTGLTLKEKKKLEEEKRVNENRAVLDHVNSSFKVPVGFDRMSVEDKKKVCYDAYRASGMSMHDAHEAVDKLNLK